jgi:hypothetical protein
MKKTPDEIEVMLSEIANGLKSPNSCQVYVWLTEQREECGVEDAFSLAMGVIAHLMPNFPLAHGPLH